MRRDSDRQGNGQSDPDRDERELQMLVGRVDEELDV